MNHSSCENRHEAIVALAIGELPPDDATELLRHLETCPECQSLYEEVVESEVFVQSAFAKISKAIIAPQIPGQQIDRVEPSARPAKAAARRSLGQRWKWTPAKVLALAAAFVLAATGLFSRLPLVNPSFGATFADVLQRIQKARSVTYKMKVEVDGREPRDYQEMAIHPGHLRSVRSDGELSVYDYANGEEVYISPTRRTARLVHMVRHDRQRLGHYLEWVATMHEAHGVFVGQQDLDERKTNVFRVSRPFEQITVWADTQTNLPVRIERILSPCLDKNIKVPALSLFLSDFSDSGSPVAPKSAATDSSCRILLTGPGVREHKMTMTLTGFAWDVALDESLFALGVPEGFRVTRTDVGEPLVDEEALIASLRFWAETSDETFPADIDMLLDARPRLIKKFDKDGPPEQEYADALKMAYVVANGMLFAQKLKTVDNWHYFGKDAKAGEADKPLCWWKDERRAVCRVVYGNLEVHDVLLAEVPQLKDATTAPSPSAPVGAP